MTVNKIAGVSGTAAVVILFNKNAFGFPHAGDGIGDYSGPQEVTSLHDVEPPFDQFTAVSGLCTGDFDGDGKVDVAVSGNNSGFPRIKVLVGAVASAELPYRYRAIIWDRENGTRNLNDLLDPCGAPALNYLSEARAINNRGQIVCRGVPDVGLSLAVRLDPYVPGDLNEDGSVALQDLATLLGNFDRAGDAAYEHGDLDCDADVDLQDLATLLSNFGETLP